MERHIVHFDLDAFFIGVELLKDSRLKGLPLVVGGKGDRGVVAACSYEARKFGVHSAMPMKMARRLCPEMLVLSSDWESYSKYSRMVTEIIESKVPLYEKSSVDEFYIDLTGMDKYFGCSKYSQELKQLITKETGLSITYGLASNKLISKVATNEVKPDGQILIPYGDERGYLSPMPVEKLPMVGLETSKLLKSMGVHKVKTLAEIPIEYLVNMFGKNGHGLWQKANGIDDSPVVPYHEQKSIGTEETFGNDTINIGFMESKLVAMTEKVGFELRQSHHLTGCITVTVRYANFDTISKQKQITYTNADHILLPRVKELFHTLYDRRLRVRLLGVRFSHLVPGNYQISLFDDTAEAINLYSAIDSIKNQFGAGSVTRATTLLYPKTR